ncbi:MAG: Y-family DNA polymerase [Acidobacteriaceae bacterium]
MPAIRAERLCPDAIFAPPDFPRYRAVSRSVRETFKQHTDLVEPLSLDERRLEVVARNRGIKKAKDSDSIPKLLSAYIRKAEEGELEQFQCYCDVGIVLSHASFARMGHPNLTLSVKML